MYRVLFVKMIRFRYFSKLTSIMKASGTEIAKESEREKEKKEENESVCTENAIL